MPLGKPRGGMIQPWHVGGVVTARNLACYVVASNGGPMSRESFKTVFLKHMKTLTTVTNPQAVANVWHQVKLGNEKGLRLESKDVIAIADEEHCLAIAAQIEEALKNPPEKTTNSVRAAKSRARQERKVERIQHSRRMVDDLIEQVEVEDQEAVRQAQPPAELAALVPTYDDPMPVLPSEDAFDYTRLALEMLGEVSQILSKGEVVREDTTRWDQAAERIAELENQLETTETRLYEQTQVSERLRADVRAKQNQIEELGIANGKLKNVNLTLLERVRAAENNFNRANEQNNGAIEAEVAKRLRPIMGAPGGSKG
jgi:hypothetical protein